MGVFGGTWSVGWAADAVPRPEVRDAYGDATMWVCVATVGVIAGITGSRSPHAGMTRKRPR